MMKLPKPSVLERTPEQRGIKEKHSPWTAPRDKKKKRSTYDHSLPDVDESQQSHQHGKDSQQQQDLKPRFIAVNLDVFSHAGMHGTFPSRSAAEPAHGGNLGGECAQGFNLRKDVGSAPRDKHPRSVPPLEAHRDCAAGQVARRPSSAGVILEAPRGHDATAAMQRGFTCDPFAAIHAGASDTQQQCAQPGTSGRGGSGAARDQSGASYGEVKAQSCDFPIAGGPPVDPLMPDSCSTDFASVAARRPAFQAAFYFGARRRPEADAEPFAFGEHGPLAAGVQRFSTSLPDAHLLQDSPTAAAASPLPEASTPNQDHQRQRGHVNQEAAQQMRPGSGGAVEAMEVCGSGGGSDVTPQARHAQLLWPASLQRLRRAARQSTQSPVMHAGAADPDMQPLGRHISGVCSPGGCDTPNPARQPWQKQPSGKEEHAGEFVAAGENVPRYANHAAMRTVVEGTAYAKDGGRARGRARCGGHSCGGRGPASEEQQRPQRSPMMEVSRAGPGMLQSPGSAWQAPGCSPMQIDVQPTRLGRLHAVMEMSTLDATIDGTRVSGSFTQLQVQHGGVAGGTSQVLQWQMEMQRGQHCTSSSTSSGGSFLEPRANMSPCSSEDSRDMTVCRTKLSGLLMSGDVASPGSMLMITGDKLAETFSPFAAGTPAPPAPDEHGFTCSQVLQASNGDLAPKKPPGSSTVKDAVSNGKLATFNDRLHEAVVNGDVDLVGQAWQQVHTGDVQPDIDTLNALLKSFCRVKGDPCIKEAEQLVAQAMKHGCQPNAATYHHLTDITMRHEMMACPDEDPEPRERDPFVTP